MEVIKTEVTTTKKTTIEIPEHEVFRIIKEYISNTYGVEDPDVRLDNDFRYGCSADMTATVVVSKHDIQDSTTKD